MKSRTRIRGGSPLGALELGFARLLDFSGALTTYTYVHRPDQHDAAAIATDWQRVGGHFRVARHKADKLIAGSGSGR